MLKKVSAKKDGNYLTKISKWHFGGCLYMSRTRQTTHLNSDKKVNFGVERNGAFAANPLGESPRNSSHGGIF